MSMWSTHVYIWICMSTLVALRSQEIRGKGRRPTPQHPAGINKATKGHYITKVTPSPKADEALSRNISSLLENLLHNYDSSQHPNYGTGFPTVVSSNILIRSMGPISELDMDYSTDCYFRQYWRDSRLSFDGPIKDLSLSISMLERIWRPDTYFHNGKNSYLHTITRPNKFLRLAHDGQVVYSMRLTIKAKCPMALKDFPMDRQTCPLVFGSYAYTSRDLAYQWQGTDSVSFVSGMTLSQFDLMASSYSNHSIRRVEGNFSVLEVHFNLQRHTGYFLIQVYLPCILIVVLSWVGFWIHREATSDRVGLGITTVLTLSTISLDSRVDLPKVHYATALDWFLLMSFGYCIATLLQFAAVHYFTKVGSGEIFMDEDDWEEDTREEIKRRQMIRSRRKNAIICPIYNERLVYGVEGATQASPSSLGGQRHHVHRTGERRHDACWRQCFHCLIADDKYRRRRQKESSGLNSVSKIDQAARVLFPLSFFLLNFFYWMCYGTTSG